RFLRIFHEYVKVPVLIEYPGVNQLVLQFLAVAPPVSRRELMVWVGPLGILVQILHVRMRWRAIQVIVVLLYVLAVITLAVGEAEQALFQNGILPIPQRHCKTEPLAVITNPGQAVFAPAIRART